MMAVQSEYLMSVEVSRAYPRGKITKTVLRRGWVDARGRNITAIAVYRQDRFKDYAKLAKVVFHPVGKSEHEIRRMASDIKRVLRALPLLYSYTTELAEKLFEFIFIRLFMSINNVDIHAHWSSDGDIDVLIIYYE